MLLVWKEESFHKQQLMLCHASDAAISLISPCVKDAALQAKAAGVRRALCAALEDS